MNIDYICKNEECQHEFSVHIYADGECWEEECPSCNTEIDSDEIEESFKPDPDDYQEEA